MNNPTITILSAQDLVTTINLDSSTLFNRRPFTLIFKKKTFIEPNEYQEYKVFYSKAVREDRRQLLLKKVE